MLLTERPLTCKKTFLIDDHNGSLADLLRKVSLKSKLGFKRVNNVIFVKRITVDIKNQPVIEEIIEVVIKGKVTSENGESIPGVNVLVKGTAIGTVTDVNGDYVLRAPDNATTLIFSSIGFITTEVPIDGRSIIDLTMNADVQTLSEVVVVGYGTQEKVNLTGAVGTAKGEVLENRPIANVGEGLQGVIPNLNVTPQNGDPSAPVDFNIRGYESINGGSPLILVDNVPMDLNSITPMILKASVC